MYNEVDCGIHPYKDNFVGLDFTKVAITYELRHANVPLGIRCDTTLNVIERKVIKNNLAVLYRVQFRRKIAYDWSWKTRSHENYNYLHLPFYTVHFSGTDELGQKSSVDPTQQNVYEFIINITNVPHSFYDWLVSVNKYKLISTWFSYNL